MKTSRLPAITPGIDSGRVTSTNARQGFAPRSWEASSSAPSSFSSVE